MTRPNCYYETMKFEIARLIGLVTMFTDLSRLPGLTSNYYDGDNLAIFREVGIFLAVDF